MFSVGLFLIIIFLYTSIVEYIAHRWFMHQPLGGSYWKEHAIEHHFKKRFDINIAIGPTIVIIASIPLLLLSFFFNIYCFILTLSCCFCYSIIWTFLHNCHHDIKYYWLNYIPFYNIWRIHHLNHHKHPSKNFGTICIWTDYLFGTKI